MSKKGPKLTKSNSVQVLKHCLETIQARLDPTEKAKFIMEDVLQNGYHIVYNHQDLRDAAATLMHAGLLETEDSIDFNNIIGGGYQDRKVLLRNDKMESVARRILGASNTSNNDAWFKCWRDIKLDAKYPRGFFAQFFMHQDTAELRANARTALIKVVTFPEDVEKHLTELTDIVHGTVYVEDLVDKLPELENLIREVTACKPITTALAIRPSKSLTSFIESMAPIPDEAPEAGSFA